MTTEEALKVLIEMQKWRRGEEPYGDTSDPKYYKGMPYSPEEFGKAIDVAIDRISLICRI